MYEMNEYATAQRTSRRGPTRRNLLLLVPSLAAVLVLLVLVMVAWNGRSDQAGAGSPVSGIGASTPGPSASAAPSASADPSGGEPGQDGGGGSGDQGSSASSGGSQGGGSQGGDGGDQGEDPENPDPEDPEDPEIVLIDPAIVLPWINPTVHNVAAVPCPNNVTVNGTIEISALETWYPMTLEYRWVGSGEFFGPTQSIDLAGNAVLPVSVQRPAAVAGWVALEIKGPFPTMSEKVETPACVTEKM